MSLTMVAGPDDTVHEGIQNNPVEGAVLPAIDLVVGDQMVRDYVNAVGDEGFWAFRAAALAKHGTEVVPATLFDREIGAELVGLSARFAMHAKQGFTFRGLIVPGETYRMAGSMVSITQRRGIDYFTVETTCSPLSDLQHSVMDSRYTRAFRFPDNQYNRSEPKPRAKLSEWLAENGLKARERFPNPGAVVEGRTTLVDQATVNLYSGPDSSVHTDNQVARRGGLSSTVAQGLMATELEHELYRDLFGLALYKRGSIDASYIAPIPSGVSLRAASIVGSVSDEVIELRTAVATAAGEVVSVSRVSVRHWATEADVE